jgi:serine/threonine protein kinase
MVEGSQSVLPLPGELLAGKYRIERMVGQGAMGLVFAARHLQLEQRVAIKFLRPEINRRAGVGERFLREAKAAARIQGEHVVRVFDVGELDGGVPSPFFVMEYVEGMNLAELIAAEGPLPFPTAVDYVLQACEALSQAHQAGIVHRDVKPSNLLISSRPNGSALVKLLDFGISKVSSAPSTSTDATALLGSPLYMSPEQLISSRDVDKRADIWSVGVVLFELLTGALPFVGDTIPELCVHIRELPAPSPRVRRPDLPVDLEAIVLRCLEKQPSGRFATISELAAALRPFAHQPAGVARSPSPAAERAKIDVSASRRRPVVAGMALVGTLAVAAAVLWLRYPASADRTSFHAAPSKTAPPAQPAPPAAPALAATQPPAPPNPRPALPPATASVAPARASAMLHRRGSASTHRTAAARSRPSAAPESTQPAVAKEAQPALPGDRQ